MKILFIVIDGLSDKPIKKLGNKTPLEVAKTPNLDFLAKNGTCGLIEPAYSTAIPTSEETHFGLFGYDPRACKIKRGVLTALGTGIKLKKSDVALRANFAIVDKNLNMIDRRAGRISQTKALIKVLSNIEIDGIKFLIKSAGEYRLAIVMRGKNLSPDISDNDPYYSAFGKKARKVRPLKKIASAQFTAKVLNKFLDKAREILEQAKSPANYILTRGASSLQKLPSFQQKYKLKAACVADKLLYKQIGKFLGMDLNRNPEQALKKYDFVFWHVKDADSLAEDGDFLGKKKFIEKFDRGLKWLTSDVNNRLIVVTADHSTCSEMRRHCVEPVPVLIYGKDKDNVKQFSEKACKQGKLGKIKALALMSRILYYIKN